MKTIDYWKVYECNHNVMLELETLKDHLKSVQTNPSINFSQDQKMYLAFIHTNIDKNINNLKKLLSY